MISKDVTNCFKKRITCTQFASSFLQEIPTASVSSHECVSDLSDADLSSVDKLCSDDHHLSNNEQMACAYVAGWLERNCEDPNECVDESLLVDGHTFAFIDELSNGKVTVPSSSSYLLVSCVMD